MNTTKGPMKVVRPERNVPDFENLTDEQKEAREKRILELIEKHREHVEKNRGKYKQGGKHEPRGSEDEQGK